GEVSLLRDDVSSLTYLSAHPRQLDHPLSSWDWGDLLLGRRTDAFVRNLSRLAQNTPTRAFRVATHQIVDVLVGHRHQRRHISRPGVTGRVHYVLLIRSRRACSRISSSCCGAARAPPESGAGF